MSNKHSKDHVFLTYIFLRKGIVVLTCLLPVLLIGYGLFQNIEIQNSLSSYYHACPEGYKIPDNILSLYETNSNDENLKELVSKYSYAYYHTHPSGQFLRSIFVGFMIAIGLILYLYKGYHKYENIALNFAGGFAVLVALFPMAWKDPTSGYPIFEAVEFGKFSVHGIAAVLIVFCVAYICICRPSKTLQELDDPKLKKRFTTEYNILGALMIILPVSVVVYLFIVGAYQQWVLWVEIAVLLVFARYWWTRSKEITMVNAAKAKAEDRLIAT